MVSFHIHIALWLALIHLLLSKRKRQVRRGPLSKPQFRKHKDEQDQEKHQSVNPGIQKHPSPPPLALCHFAQRAHASSGRLHALLRLGHALARAAHSLLIRLEGRRELLRAGLERARHLQNGVGECVLFRALLIENGLGRSRGRLRRRGLAAVGEERRAR